MLKCARVGNRGRDLGIAFQILSDWDYRFDLESSGATLFHEWETQISKHLHNEVIADDNVRLSLLNHPAAQSSFFVSVKEWAQEKATRETRCYLPEINENQPSNQLKNTCQEFMAHTLMKALEFLQQKYGVYDSEVNNWRYGNFQYTLYVH